MKFLVGIYIVVAAFSLLGCETVHKAGKETGKVAGKTMETVGSVSEGGAEVYHGGETEEENPFGR
ncbi:hypothetical protein ACFL38_03895 [Candidatus Omnitrophota bacterium]